MSEQTSQEIAAIAARLINHEDPDVRAVAGSALTQAPDRKGALRQTHTYAVMGVSQSTYAEVHRKLLEAGYEHAIMDNGELDMHGIALGVENAA